MCCRYYYSVNGWTRALNELDMQVEESFILPDGQIGPGDKSLMISGRNGRMAVSEATWGFPSKDGGLVINARAETALVRPMFSSSMLYRRCVIPAESFWEWDYSKNKVGFTDPAGSMIYLAGIWNLIDGIMRFVVMTTAANAAMLPVHDRMPLIIAGQDVRRWVLDGEAFKQLIQREMPSLAALREEEQLSLF